MGTTSEKLTYLNGTKTLLKDVINYSGAGITSETTFRNYVAKLYDGYVDILKNKYVLLDNMPKGQVEGISAVINNAEDLPVYELKMTKESTQYTTTGAQLFDKDNANILNNRYLGSKIAGQAGTKTLYISCKPNTTYTVSKIISARFIVGTTNNIPDLNETVYNRVQDYSVSKITITTDSLSEYLLVFYYYSTYDTLTEQEILNSIQIEEGSTATSYEPYTGGQPSPNPDYPQEVNVVEGYRNLLNISNYYVRETRTNVEVNLTTGSLIATDDRNYTNKMIWFNIPIENETTYKINYKNNTFTRIQYAFSEQSLSTWTEVNALTRTDVPSTGTITSSDVNLIIVLTMNNTTLEASIDNLIITEGDQELPYVSYGNNYILYKQVGKNLYKPYFWQRTNNGIYFTHNLDGSINVDKTSTGSAYSLNSSQAISNNFTFILNPGTYTLSGGKTNIYINLTNLEGNNIATTSSNKLSITFILSEKTECFLRAQVSSGNTYNNEKIYPLLEVGSEATEYEAYKENIIPIPLNNNIIVGIGDYKDELKVDKSGNVFVNKKTGKIIFNGTTNAFSSKSSSVNNNAFISDEITNIKTPLVNNNKIDMFSSHFIATNAYEVVNNDVQKNAIRTDAKIIFGFGLSSTLTTKELANTWLSSNNVTTYYPLSTPELIDLQTTVDINLFKGVNNISNSEDGLMNVEYVKEYEEGE